MKTLMKSKENEIADKRFEEIKDELRECFTMQVEKDGKIHVMPDDRFSEQSISIRELWIYCVGPTKPISWVSSYRTLIRYVSSKYVDIFKPTIEGSNSGKRYFITIDNIATFIRLREQNKLVD
jgi:hypothetical protein